MAIQAITPGTNYTVRPGDTLSGIAQQAYGDGNLWPVIYNYPANKATIGPDPNLLKPGEVLFIPLLTPVDTTRSDVALASFNKKLYIAWTGTDASGRLNIMSSSDGGTTFGNKQTLPQASFTGPSMAVFSNGSTPNQLYIAWTGTDVNNTLNIGFFDQFDTFHSMGPVNFASGPQHSGFSPALAAFDNGTGPRLFIAWRGKGGAGEGTINIAFSSDGSSFGSVTTLPGQFTDADPALIAFGSPALLYLAWTGKESRRRLNIASSSDGVNFGSQLVLEQSSLSGPSLTTFDNALYLAWTGTNPDHNLNVISSPDGQHFTDPNVLPAHSDEAPTLVDLEAPGLSRLFIGWKGVGGSGQNRLNIAPSSDGVHFGPINTLP